MKFSKLTISLMLLLAGAPAAHAVHLEAIGPVYPIVEEDALQMILRKLQDKARRGELEQLKQAGIQRSLNSVKYMKPVPGIQTVSVRSQRLIDPSVTYQQAVTTDEGQIVVPAGTTINPLDVMSLSKALVFFDGRDPDQAEAVRRLLSKPAARPVVPILVAGSWLDLSRAWKTQVFYDQQGVMSQRFGISAVPAVIQQKGRRLQIDEIPAKELR